MPLGRTTSLVTFYKIAQPYSAITLCLPYSFFMAFSLPDIPYIDLVFIVFPHQDLHSIRVWTLSLFYSFLSLATGTGSGNVVDIQD